MIRISEAQKTFSARAENYNIETNWVKSLRLIDPLVPRPSLHDSSKKFLDVCAGTGSVAMRACQLGWDVVAIDQNFEMIKGIDSHIVKKLAICSGELLPFRSNSFDIVAIRQALHYFKLEDIINELVRVSRGRITLGHITMFSEEDRSIWAEYFRIASPGRLHIFYPGQITKLLIKLGGKVVSEKILTSIEEFEGPINHLSPDAIISLKKLFISSPSKFKEKYFVDDGYDKSKLKIQLRWEFITSEF